MDGGHVPRAQFGSAGAVLSAVGAAFLGPFVGSLVDVVGDYYRMCLIVSPIFHGLALIGSIILHRWPKSNGTADVVPGVP